MSYSPQVDKTHYTGLAYRSGERWNSYWHQLALVRAATPKEVLEVGVGEGVVAAELRRGGIAVTTVDIAPDLSPDVVGSVTKLPVGDKTFDLVLAAEVLEHIQFADVSRALLELVRVARSTVVISLPHPGYVFSVSFKLPLLPKIELFFQIPFAWMNHAFDGEHYWELGKRGFSVRTFLHLARDAGLTLSHYKRYADDPAHRYFVFTVVRP